MRKFKDLETGKTLIVLGETSEHYIGIDLKKSKVSNLEKKTSVTEERTELSIADFPVLESIVNNTYAIAGQARTGKDTFADKMEEVINKKYQDTYIYRSTLTTPIKKIQKIMFEADGKKNRDELIYIGQTLRINNPVIWIETWLRYVIAEAEHTLKTQKNIKILVTDVRQTNEIEFFQSLGAFIVKTEVAQIDLQRKQLALEGTSVTTVESTRTETDLLSFRNPDLLVLHNYDRDFTKEVESIFK